MYHEVDGPDGPSLDLFRRQMTAVTERSRTAKLEDLPGALEPEDPLVIVTFDDGDRRTCDLVLPVLSELGISATFFLPSGLLGRRLATSDGERTVVDEARALDLVSAGHEVGGHTRSHVSLSTIPIAAAREEIVGDREALAELLGRPPQSFAYPKGDESPAIRGLAREAGYRLGVTTEEAHLRGALDPMGLPRILVNRSMGMVQFRAKLSSGLRVYEGLRGRS